MKATTYEDSQEKMNASEEESVDYLDTIRDAVKTIAEKDKEVESIGNRSFTDV